MITTMELLKKAEELHPIPYWQKKLNLSRNALHSSRQRGNLSPAIAGALAEELGEDVDQWIVTAALESERDSACKRRMVARARNKNTPDFHQGRSVENGLNVRTIFECFEDSLDINDEHEAEARRMLRAILDAFPPETDKDTEKKKPLQANLQGLSWRKRRDSNPR